jgi:hypothetical protein
MNCAHLGCACKVDDEDEYCSEICSGMAANPPVDLEMRPCECGHLACAEAAIEDAAELEAV